ncbi:hypothetical protein CJ179_47765 [Rhodococcus sp. ACS1]|uniref:alcohol dehydrogenase catalytic domain-containing protein n=1 Tax=unclassified Rhodococcus (in: high G+C Gram-positive bacteria) TaxID=192944 RepID=UPI00077A022D|nr:MULTISPECIES: alcohol dehydrogenase catalytic domain-containing protein [unclassified Rhodococcus (in: high G+C Gram-positive bacteria)]KXX59913.1 hypothetical protein AZG88_00275 [Rhodococcus sp. LB1]PBC35317.1 hypothetical protein CJ179_47765 [Rhodococcus sp. ACS1]
MTGAGGLGQFAIKYPNVTIQNAGPGMPSAPYFPWTLGHDNTGHVQALGDGVTGLDVGDAVAVWPGWGDGTCRICGTGHEHICPNVSYVGVTPAQDGRTTCSFPPPGTSFRWETWTPLSALTPARIVAVDIDASKREHAVTIGASMAVDSSSDEAVRQLLDVSGDGLGVDAVIDFVGVDSTLALALAAGAIALVVPSFSPGSAAAICRLATRVRTRKCR